MLLKLLFFILLTSFAFPQNGIVKVEKIRLSPQLNEISGMAIYKDSLLVVINDSGNTTDLFILNLRGEIIRAVPVSYALNRDWEALALSSDQKTLYIGDTGNNSRSRKDQTIYVLNMEEVLNGVINSLDSLKVNLPDGKQHDIEAITLDDNLVLFSKKRKKEKVMTEVYFQTDVVNDKVNFSLLYELELPAKSFVKSAITDVHYFEKEWYILTYKQMYIYDENFNLQREIKFPRVRQYEALTVGKTGIFVACERHRFLGGPFLFHYKKK